MELEDQIDDLPLFNPYSGNKINLNNLYKIKVKVESQIKKSSLEEKKKNQIANEQS